MLEIADLHAGHGRSRVLQGVTLRVAPGQLVCLLGRNGSGRSTLARCIMGLMPSQGVVRWHGQSLQGLRPFEVARRGVGYVPEERAVFPSLTVEQNVLLGVQPAGARAAGLRRVPEIAAVPPPAGLRVESSAPWRPEDCWRMFPALQARRETPAGALSGGEQQMLALCRCLMGQPRLLVVDEPTEGLAPQVVAQVGALLRALRERGVAVLLIEQKLTLALEIADRLLVMGQGRVVFEGDPQALVAAADIRRQWLEV
jgi:branched-chain amino acid transport system ATP-binding protein